jgi:hypothetical protein
VLLVVIDQFWVALMQLFNMDQYDYQTNASTITMTEMVGGIDAPQGASIGVPIIGFSVMSADVGAARVVGFLRGHMSWLYLNGKLSLNS